MNVEKRKKIGFRLLKEVFKYSVLFLVRALCSAATLQILTVFGLEFKDRGETIFIAALTSFLVLIVINWKLHREEREGA